MKKSIFLIVLGFVIPFIIFSCYKSGNSITNCDDKMTDSYKSKYPEATTAPHPTALNSLVHYLAKGNYKSQTVYYVDIICPVCDVMPPQYGFNCSMDTVKFDNFRNVSKEKILLYW